MAGELLERVGLSAKDRNRYPNEFSGGQRQRIGIARALSVDPEFLFCDEPLSALDVSVQAQIMNLFLELQEENHLTYMFVSHDISMVRHLSNRIVVFYMGKIVEMAQTEELCGHPEHPYTRLLLSSVPISDPIQERKREKLIGYGELEENDREKKDVSLQIGVRMWIQDVENIVDNCWRLVQGTALLVERQEGRKNNGNQN